MERFEAPLIAADRGGAYVEVPPGVVVALGGGGRIKVQATFDGLDYRGSVVTMGDRKVIGVLKSIRQQLGKAPGDAMVVTLEVDAAPRTVIVPDDLTAAFAAAGAEERFGALSFSHQREYVAWITEAKRAETRARRVAQTVERVLGG